MADKNPDFLQKQKTFLQSAHFWLFPPSRIYALKGAFWPFWACKKIWKEMMSPFLKSLNLDILRQMTLKKIDSCIEKPDLRNTFCCPLYALLSEGFVVVTRKFPDSILVYDSRTLESTISSLQTVFPQWTVRAKKPKMSPTTISSFKFHVSTDQKTV